MLFRSEFFVVPITDSPDLNKQELLEINLQYARELGAEILTLTDSDPASAILEFAVQRGITQIFVGRSSTPPDFWTRMRGNLAVRLIRAAEGIDVIVYPNR